jgi:hypothetical protein
MVGGPAMSEAAAIVDTPNGIKISPAGVIMALMALIVALGAVILGDISSVSKSNQDLNLSIIRLDSTIKERVLPALESIDKMMMDHELRIRAVEGG